MTRNDRNYLWLSAAALIVALVALISSLTPGGKQAMEVKQLQTDLQFLGRVVTNHNRLIDEGKKETNARLIILEDRAGVKRPAKD